MSEGPWEVLFEKEFGQWWKGLNFGEQEDVRASILLLREYGPMLGRPDVGTIRGSRHSNMKELITQHKGKPYRTFFAFNPERRAILLIGGCKTGDNRFYEKMIPQADKIFDRHLAGLARRSKGK